MLFQNDFITPAAVSHPEVHALLVSATEQTGKRLTLACILLCILERATGSLLDILSQSLRGKSTLQEVGQRLRARHEPGLGDRSSPCSEMTSEAQQAMAHFDAMMRENGTDLQPVALEVLTHLTLCYLEPVAREELRGLMDVTLAAGLLEGWIADTLQVASEEPLGSDEPFSMSPFVVPWEDLTKRAQCSSHPEELPFQDEGICNKLFDGIARILHRRSANHVFLVGERGCGKTTLVTEMARRAAEGQIPFLRDKRFLLLDCRYVPPEESRQVLVAVLSQFAEQEKAIVCVDGFATLLRGERGTNQALLFSFLSSSRCQFIGLLTPGEHEEQCSEQLDFLDFFGRVDVEEPELETALKLLSHFAQGLEEKFHVRIESDAVREAVVLSSNYILNDQLPAKALKILHRACEDFDYERQLHSTGGDCIRTDDVLRVVSEQSGVPEETLRGVADRADYEQGLKELVFGQDHVVQAVAEELGLIKSGMTHSGKPASVLLFLGQTGTGKTEMAKALARFYSTSKRLRTYALGNCVEAHSVSTIIGVPPGYVGTDRGGRLINELNADPYGVFLLDEVDKAHPDVLQPFLNLFDEGWVSDQRGAKAYASKSIFILTSNVGQRMIADMVAQGKSLEEITERMKEALSQIRHTKSERPVFTPEFLARIKRILVFHPLSEQAMNGIAQKLLGDLQQEWLTRRGKTLELDEWIVQTIAQRSYQINEKAKGKEGGRIVQKLITEHIESKLQKAITSHSEEYHQSQALKIHIPAQINPCSDPSTREDLLQHLRIQFVPTSG